MIGMIKKKRSFCYYVGSGVVAIVALFMMFSHALAQNGPAPAANPPERIVGGFEHVKALPPGGPAPRMADGHVDLSGRWYPNSSGQMLQGAYPIDQAIFRQFDPKVTPEVKPVFKPGMEAKYNAPYPYGICDQAGTPTTLTMQQDQHAPIELMQKPGMLTLLAEYPLDVRKIHTDGRPHPKDPDPTFNGDSTAHWEGDTLVVDVIAIDDRLRNIDMGYPPQPPEDGGKWLHSDQEHVVERFTRPSKNYLIYQVTVDDPIVLAKPWLSAPRKWSLAQDPNDDWQEVFCTHNEEPGEYQRIKENSDKAKGKQ